MATALCPGSFDPPTNGHLDVIRRSARHFDSLIVAVIDNPAKQPLFAAGERVELLERILGDVPNTQVVSFGGLLVDLARERGVTVVVKGLRAVSDFEYELQMAQMNSALSPELDTFFVSTRPEWSFLSSSLVKEVARFGGDVASLVPSEVAAALAGRLGGA
ncbi:MAG: pantetheine-phosphate adenylyltransferase [Actinomycetota bacterium]